MFFAPFVVSALGLLGAAHAKPYSPPVMDRVPAGVKVPANFVMPTVAEMAQYKEQLALSLLVSINATIAVTSVLTGTATASFVAQNPVPIPVTVKHVSAKAGVNGTSYASFNSDFTGLVLAPSATGRSAGFSAKLDQGVLNSIGLLVIPYLDLQDANLTLAAYDFIPIELTDITQAKVPATYQIVLV